MKSSLLIGLVTLLMSTSAPSQSVGFSFSSEVSRHDLATNSSHSHEGRLAFTAYDDGNWDIYSLRADGSELRRVTQDLTEDGAPAWSPDGTKLAFQSKRDGNWDIYVLSLDQSSPRRLTSDPSYDGAPCWSPDGKQIAFESYREGDLDIFVMNADGSSQTNMTPANRTGDYDPNWSPDGATISFTSGRMGDSDIFLLDLSTGEVTQWTDSSRPEGNSLWSPDGKILAYVQREPDRREIFVGDAARSLTDGNKGYRLTWFGCDDAPVWSPVGGQIAYIAHVLTNRDMEYLLLQDFGEARNAKDLFSTPEVLLSGWEIVGPLSWTANDSTLGEVVQTFVPADRTFSPGLVQPVGTDASVPSDKFSDLSDLEAPNARLNAKLVEPFIAVRENIRAETGYDFLSEVSDMWRGVDAYSEGSAYLSWHKAGRAFDTLFDYRDESNYPLLEVVREDIGGETCWRVYIKAADQDGSMGMPLKVQPWDLTGNARRKFPDDGGTWKSIPYGYYVDITRIIRHAGWERLSSVDRPDFSWRWHFLGIEYWHYQWRDDLEWYDAMEDVYSTERIESLFNWRDLVAQGEKPYNLFNNGVPIAPEASKWNDLQR